MEKVTAFFFALFLAALIKTDYDANTINAGNILVDVIVALIMAGYMTFFFGFLPTIYRRTKNYWEKDGSP